MCSPVPGEIRVEHIPLPVDFPVSSPTLLVRDERAVGHPHVHDALELGICRSGSGVCLVGGHVYSYQSGDCSFIDTHEVHFSQSNSAEASRWEVVHLDPMGVLGDCLGRCPGILRLQHRGVGEFRSILCCRRYPRLSELVKRLFEELWGQGRHYRLVFRSLFWELMLLLDREFPVREDAVLTSVRHDEVRRVLPAVNHMGSHFRHEISIPELAGLCFMSEANFRKVFHRAMGCAPLDYLRHVRLSAAVALIRHSDRPIGEIALSCGFGQFSSFNRLFHSRYGMSPRGLRAQARTYGQAED